MTELSGLGAIPIPAQVREAGTDAVKTYKSALGFEGMLLDKLSDTLVEDSGIKDSPYASTVSGAFTSSLLQGGGLGLGEQLYQSIMQRNGSPK